MKYIFWDFNGTILDDVDLCVDILNEMLEFASKKEISKNKYLEIFDFPIMEYYKKAGFDFDEISFDVLAKLFIDKYQKRSLKCLIHKNFIETIKYFRKKGYVQVILSASETVNLLEQVEHFNIKGLFDYILGTTDIYASSKVSVAKKFVKEHHIECNDILVIGDTLHDAKVAKEIGANIIIYTKGHQSKERLKEYEQIDDFKKLRQNSFFEEV